MMNIVTQHACIHYSGDTVLVTLSALNYSKLCLCKDVQHAGRLLMMLLPTTKLSTLLRSFSNDSKYEARHCSDRKRLTFREVLRGLRPGLLPLRQPWPWPQAKSRRPGSSGVRAKHSAPACRAISMA